MGYSMNKGTETTVNEGEKQQVVYVNQDKTKQLALSTRVLNGLHPIAQGSL